MPLTFPTQAEQCVAQFKSSPKTIAIPTIAKEMGAVVCKRGSTTEYCFDDDTSLTVTGTGRAHKIEVHLP